MQPPPGLLPAGGIPCLSKDQAAEIARRHYGLDAAVSALDSYTDQNFRLDREGEKNESERWVLKVANAETQRAVIEFENSMAQCLADADLPVPKILPNRDGETITDTHGHLVRLISWRHGTPLTDIANRPTTLLEDVGALMGRVDNALANLDHPGMHRPFFWDVRLVDQLRPLVGHLEGEQRRRIEGLFDNFEERVRPFDKDLRISAVHNDANDANILVTRSVSGAYEITGLIDFSDSLYSWTIYDLAIAVAYIILGQDEPLKVGSHVVRGYERERPMTEVERRVLFDLVMTRLASSAMFSRYLLSLNPENTYLAVNIEPIWRLFDQVQGLSPTQATEMLCGLQGS